MTTAFNHPEPRPAGETAARTRPTGKGTEHAVASLTIPAEPQQVPMAAQVIEVSPPTMGLCAQLAVKTYPSIAGYQTGAVG